MSPTSLLAGRGAVVVGGSLGIGAAVAALLAQHGAAVVVNGRNAAAAQTTADAIVRAGGRAVAHPGSPSDEEAAESLIARCISEFDGIQILINCAGIPEPPGSSILDISPAQFHELLDAHLGTVFATCRAAAPRMVAQGGGVIVNTSSFAFLGDYGGTGYPAGKGAVNSLTLAIAVELKEHGGGYGPMSSARVRRHGYPAGPTTKPRSPVCTAAGYSMTPRCGLPWTRRRPSMSRPPTSIWPATTPRT